MTVTTAGRATLTDVVELACLAPSVHNTQPWSWQVHESSIELFADDRRRLPVADPLGQRLVVSCGAALHHAQVAAAALGWLTAVERLPDGPESDLLARIGLTRARPPAERAAALASLRARRTDRRRFTSWPVPDERVRELARVAREWGVVASPVTDVIERDAVEMLLGRAFDAQAADPLLAREQSTWVDHGVDDGVPAGAVPDTVPDVRARRSRFGDGTLQDSDHDVEDTDGLLVLGTVDDDRAGWLRTGEALSALWLDATAGGLSVVPLSQVIEVAETRRALHREVLGTLAVPHVLVRIGWPSVSRAELPASPRRPLDDVLRAGSTGRG
ncbi:nitroreductase family protein [soil metagenome]